MAKVEVTLKREKECKGSVRFVTEDEKAPVTNIYLSRAVDFSKSAAAVKVTVEEVREGA